MGAMVYQPMPPPAPTPPAPVDKNKEIVADLCKIIERQSQEIASLRQPGQNSGAPAASGTSDAIPVTELNVREGSMIPPAAYASVPASAGTSEAEPVQYGMTAEQAAHAAMAAAYHSQVMASAHGYAMSGLEVRCEPPRTRSRCLGPPPERGGGLSATPDARTTTTGSASVRAGPSPVTPHSRPPTPNSAPPDSFAALHQALTAAAGAHTDGVGQHHYMWKPGHPPLDYLKRKITKPRKPRSHTPPPEDPNRVCLSCGTSSTPKWRCGMTLCNACGLRSAKKPVPPHSAAPTAAAVPAGLPGVPVADPYAVGTAVPTAMPTAMPTAPPDHNATIAAGWHGYPHGGAVGVLPVRVALAGLLYAMCPHPHSEGSVPAHLLRALARLHADGALPRRRWASPT